MDMRLVRSGVFGLALVICAGCWLYTFGSLIFFGHPGAAKWTAMVTISAVATEVTFWVGAFTIGWSIFAKRRRFWEKVSAGFRNRRSKDERAG